jgi:hypothetical protein
VSRKETSGGMIALLAREGCLCKATWLGGSMWLRRREKQDGVGESEGADSSSCYYYESSVRKSMRGFVRVLFVLRGLIARMKLDRYVVDQNFEVPRMSL